MNTVRLYAILSLVSLSSLVAKADTIINLNATQPGNSGDIIAPNNLAPSFFDTITLAAGAYSVSVVGTSTSGAVYSGWNEALSPATNDRWEERIGVNTTGGTFSTAGGSDYYSPYPSSDPEPFTGLYSSAAAALAAAQASGPYTFTLASTTAVTFYIPDEPYNSTTGAGYYPGFTDNTAAVTVSP